MKKFRPAAFSAHSGCNFKLPRWLSPAGVPPTTYDKTWLRSSNQLKSKLVKKNQDQSNFATAISMIELEAEEMGGAGGTQELVGLDGPGGLY